jgi:hypothetical protein
MILADPVGHDVPWSFVAPINQFWGGYYRLVLNLGRNYVAGGAVLQVTEPNRSGILPILGAGSSRRPNIISLIAPVNENQKRSTFKHTAFFQIHEGVTLRFVMSIAQPPAVFEFRFCLLQFTFRC